MVNQSNSNSGDRKLDGQVAAVTGATGGIGRAVALELARQGAILIVHGRRPDRTESLVDEIRNLGRAAVALSADLESPSSYASFASDAWKWHNGIDIWLNLAGADVLTGSAAGWPFEKKLTVLWQVDCLATFALSSDIGQRMKARGGGTINNIGWDQAEQGMAGDSGQMFGAIKGAVMAFTRSLAQSLAPAVRVNCLAPGWIHTSWGEQASDYWQQRAAKQSLRNRWGTPEDVAKAAAFLASPAADFITGQVININGGFRYE